MRGAITSVVAGCLVAMVAGCPRPSPARDPADVAAPEPDGPPAPLATAFGVWDASTFRRAQQIAKVEDVMFGWRIKTRCHGPVKFRETMRLPGPGDFPTDLAATTVSADRTSTTTIDYAACKRGWVEHRWVVAADDPAGTYVITVELDGYATTTFRPKFIEP